MISNVYVHLDKTTYQIDENIWFTAYGLEEMDSMDNTLFVVLHHLETDSIVAKLRFVLKDRIAKGSILLNRLLPTGKYRLLAYTNSRISNQNQIPFQQILFIEKDEELGFSLIKTAISPKPDKNNQYTVSLKVVPNKVGYIFNNNKIKYQVESDRKFLKKGKGILSTNGSVDILIPRAYEEKGNKVFLQFQADGEWKQLILPLRIRDSLWLNFYPEYGKLIAGLENRVAFEFGSALGVIGSIKANILENDKELITIVSNKYGMGSFSLLPSPFSKYKIILEDSNRSLTYAIPAIINKENTTSLSINQGVVSDYIKGTVLSTINNGDSVYLLLHDHKTIYKIHPMLIADGQLDFDFSVIGLPLGIMSLSLVDGEKQVLAERTIYIKSTEKLNVDIDTKKRKYKPREHVKVKIKIKDANGNGVSSVFSVAVVMTAKYDSLCVNSLPFYSKVRRFIAENASLPFIEFDSNNMESDLYLLTKFYSAGISKMLERTVNNTSIHPLSIGIKATITYKKKPYEGKLNYIVSSDSLHNVIFSGISSSTIIPYTALYSVAEKDVIITALPEDNKVKLPKIALYVQEPNLDRIDKVVPYSIRNTELRSISEEAKIGMNKMKVMLNETVILSKNAFEDNRLRKEGVSTFDPLGLNNGESVTATYDASSGKFYATRKEVPNDAPEETDNSNFMTKVKGVWEAKPFEVINYEEFYPEEPQTLSTIFWSHLITTDKNGEATFDYYTNDLLGNTTIHLQGLSDKGPISGKGFYQVLKEPTISTNKQE